MSAQHTQPDSELHTLRGVLADYEDSGCTDDPAVADAMQGIRERIETLESSMKQDPPQLPAEATTRHDQDGTMSHEQATTAPANCLDCPKHTVLDDPDPNDWFCDDDKAVACSLTPNPTQDLKSKYIATRGQFRLVAVSCRPYKLREESARPVWCPLMAPQGS